jgi:3'(2'), 5'-bisphosphate nucleotidase
MARLVPAAEDTLLPTLDAAACADLMDPLAAIAADACAAIRRAAADARVRQKADGSPVTAADEAAEAVICDGLARIAPSLPVISEEQAAREKPKSLGQSGSYFLVDPLDGTREFVAGREEYTVNIALVTDGAPLLGVIAAPASGLMWRGIVGRGADRLACTEDGLSPPTAIHVRAQAGRDITVLVSRSHLETRTKSYLERFPQAKLVACGSSIKFCHLAEGLADLYPRLAPTHDWDIAAGHAILEAAGGQVTAPDGSRLRYGSADLLIPEFLASGAPLTA